MIVSDVIMRVRRTFGDEAAVQVTDADVMRWINDSQIEIVKTNDGALQKSGLLNIVSGTSQYALPSDLFILRSLRYKFPDMQSFSSLRYKSMQEFDESIDGWDGTTYTTGNPYFFTKYENNVILFPTPNQSLVGGIKVLYNQQPTDVVAQGDVLALPLIYHNTIMKYCLWQASLLDEDLEPAMMYRGDFQTDMDMLRAREAVDPVDTYRTITVLDYDQ